MRIVGAHEILLTSTNIPIFLSVNIPSHTITALFDYLSYSTFDVTHFKYFEDLLTEHYFVAIEERTSVIFERSFHFI